MQLMVPTSFVVCCWSSFFCELSFMVVSVFYCFHKSRVKSYVLVPAFFFFWKIKSEIAANVPVTMCSHKQNSTPFSKLTLKPEQPPQEQVCMSNCTGGVCSFLHRCVKVCGSHQLWHNRFSGVWSGSQQLPQIWASACNDTCYSKGKWFQLLTRGSTKSVPMRITENVPAILHIPLVPLK